MTDAAANANAGASGIDSFTPPPALTPEQTLEQERAIDQAIADAFGHQSIADEVHQAAVDAAAQQLTGEQQPVPPVTPPPADAGWADIPPGEGPPPPPEPTPTIPPVPGEPGAPTTPPSTEPTVTPTSLFPPPVKVGDAEYDATEIQDLINFRNRLAADPNLAQRIRDAVSGVTPPLPPQYPAAYPPANIPSAGYPPAPPQVPVGQQPQLPADLDPNDPMVQYFTSRLAVLENETRLAQQATLHAHQQNIEHEVTRGYQSWRASHPAISDQEMSAIDKQCIDLQLLPTMMGRRDFLGNSPAPSHAIQQALEYAFRLTPSYQLHADRELETARARAVEDQTRQTKLGALSGTSGSTAPRVPPAPTTQAELDLAMTREIAQAMGTEDQLQ